MKLFFAFALFFAIFLSPLLTQHFYQSHDGEAHVARFAAYYQAFSDGQIIPRWAGNLNFGYGTPIFIFYYPLPGYLASFIHLLGINFQDTFKILMAISFILTIACFYLWAKTFLKKEIAILGALFYGLAPYHFLDLYVRGDVAEMMAFVFVPLVFWTIEKFIKTKKLLFLVLGGVFYAACILSHNGVSLMFSPVFLLYLLVRSQNRKIFLQLVVLLILGLLLSAFFWLPALYEGKYTNAKLFIGNMFKDHFPSFFQLIVPNWGFGPDVNKTGGLSPQLGLLYVGFVIASCKLWFGYHKQKKLLGFWLFVFFSALFIILPISGFVWQHFPLLRLYEFPWRFVGLASFAASVLACFVMERIKDKKILIVLLLVLILTSLPLIRVEKFISKSDSYYSNFSGTTYYHGEANPIWTAGDPHKQAEKPVEIIKGKGTVNNIEKKSQLHEYTVSTKEVLGIVDNTHYFPGWQVTVDGKKVPIQFQDPNYRGLITYDVSPGKHNVKVNFTESPIRKIANIATIFAIIFVVVFFTTTLIYNRKGKHR
jgi:uncharacterized membrane protein